jgi:hypothetical protein
MSEAERDFVNGQAFIAALRELDVIHDSTEYVWISAGTTENEEYMRIGYRHMEDGKPVATTKRLQGHRLARCEAARLARVVIHYLGSAASSQFRNV